MNSYTTETITVANTNNATNSLPEFGRWQDVQRLYGIKRGTLYNLVAEGEIKSVALRRRGNIHGCRLFHLASISNYLNRLMQAQVSQISEIGGAISEPTNNAGRITN